MFNDWYGCFLWLLLIFFANPLTDPKMEGFFSLFLLQLLWIDASICLLVMKYVGFPVICAINLISSATGTTGQNSHKTQRFYWLIWLVIRDPLLKLWNVVNLGCGLELSSAVTIDRIGHKWFSLGYFYILVGVSPELNLS